MRHRRLLAFAGIVAPLWAMWVIAAGTLLMPGSHLLRDTISQLSATDRPHGWMVGAGLSLYALLLLAFSFEARRFLGESRSGRIAAAGLMVSALATIATGLMRVSPESSPTTTTQDAAHFLSAGMAQFSLIVSMIASGMLLRRRGRTTVAAISFIAAACGIALVLCLMTGRIGGAAGLMQRIVYVQALAWIAMLGILTFRGRRVFIDDPVVARHERVAFAAGD